MAHAVTGGAYQRLAARLDRFPQGAPPSELLYRILELLFSEREAERGRSGENYLAPGHWCSLRELAAAAQAVTGARIPPVVPMALARAWSPIGTRLGRATDDPLMFTSEALHAIRFGRRVSGVKAERELGHTARPIADTVRDLYAAFGSTVA